MARFSSIPLLNPDYSQSDDLPDQPLDWMREKWVQKNEAAIGSSKNPIPFPSAANFPVAAHKAIVDIALRACIPRNYMKFPKRGKRSLLPFLRCLSINSSPILGFRR